ncbi:MAG: hypothetical protein HZA30_03170 [Candidatus Omnitrophica bacterium]|nr:hypothetical protein [Candidatus Omnitrophota bacterium]
MAELRLPQKIKDRLEAFNQGLKSIYKDALISVILYGSAASGEYSTKHSNINLAIVLDDASLANLSKASKLVRARKYRSFNPVFFTEDYIISSRDVFPIEFLDMKDNHVLLYGRDVLKDLKVDIRNLRFQCEQELKSRLINIKRLYLHNPDKQALSNLLFRSSTSVLHLLRNLIRLKGTAPAYSKEDAVKAIAQEFNIDPANFNSILAARNRDLRLRHSELDSLFRAFVSDLEKITDIVDRL